MATITELPGTTATAPDSVPSIGDAAPGKEKSDNWRFIEPQPIREDQVENAVKFLSHPKVKGSPVVYRRSFLERKGLSREEIDEAFRRVPVSWYSFLLKRVLGYMFPNGIPLL